MFFSQRGEGMKRELKRYVRSIYPSISSNLRGIAEMVKLEVRGLLFERGNVDDLAR
jgi:hypothetical protein